MDKPAPFDAVLDIPIRELEAAGPLVLVFQGLRSEVSVTGYGFRGHADSPLVLVRPRQPLGLRWKDAFELEAGDGRVIGRGTVLYPRTSDPADTSAARKKALLERLSLGEREMLLTLAEEKGLQGLREEDAAAFCRLGRSRLEGLARELEEEGAARILSFSPLFLVAQGSLEFLRLKVTGYLRRYHKKHPGQRGAPLARIENRFPAPRQVLLLALKSLVKEGTAAIEGQTVRLADFRIPLTPQDEEVLKNLEDMFLKGEFQTVSLEDIRERFHLSHMKLQTLLAVLTEREKIVEGRDGFLLHSKWLDEIVAKLHESGRKELTVAEFKAMTGLSRKYAIPLLELLDEMGVTRRRGSVRDIL